MPRKNENSSVSSLLQWRCIVKGGIWCRMCRRFLSKDSFHSSKNKKTKTASWCKECHSNYQEKRIKSPQYRLWLSSKSSSTARGREHTIRPEDIPCPTHCKYLGIEIDYRTARERGRLRAWNAPSIDRIDSSKGYVLGNIQVISDLANRMKQEATIEQLVSFARGVLKIHTD